MQDDKTPCGTVICNRCDDEDNEEPSLDYFSTEDLKAELRRREITEIKEKIKGLQIRLENLEDSDYEG